ncbi:MAG: S9 family peptidase [Phenylobacterium sp.]|nr:S9 family peptidase [Phenylobacterium sp.]
MRILLAAAALALAGPSAVHAAPLSAYGGLPSIDEIRLSPDGSTLAVIASDGVKRSLLVRPTAGGAPKVFAVGEAKVRRIDWLGTDQLIITTSQTGKPIDLLGPRREWLMGFSLDLKDDKVRPLLAKSLAKTTTGTHFRDAGSDLIGAMNTMAGPPLVRLVDGKPTLFLQAIAFKDTQGLLTIVQSNPRNGAQKIVEFGGNDTDEILLGADGAPVARSDYDGKSGRWSLKLRRPGSGSWAEVRSVAAKIDRPYMVGLGRDGQSVLLAEPDASGYLLREVGPDGAASDPLDVRDADGAIFDPETHRLIGVQALVGDERRYTFFDPRDQKAWNAVQAAFKGDPVRLESWTQDRQKIVVAVDSARDGPGYALVDLGARKGAWLAARYEKILPEDIAKVQALRFKASDGLQLTGYLTLPNGQPARNLPLVVLAHGGPEARDTPGFDWWSQAIASRGYAVLRVNFRGSDGFGRGFVEAGYGQWGRKMQTDLSDGVRHLAAQGLVDPKRVCIAGASYGGYAALAGATLDPGVYRCAASVAGLSDLRRLVEDEGRVSQRYWKRFMGVQKLGDPALAEISPLTHVGRVSIPILLVHGRDDTVVPLEQSRIMAEALQKAGKPVEYVVQDGEDHWLSRGETRLQMLTATMAFIEKHNPPN